MPPRGYTLKYVPRFKSNEMGLNEFIDYVGSESVGPERWKTGRKQLGVLMNVIEDIFYGLENEAIEACIWLNVASKCSGLLQKVEFTVDAPYWEDRRPSDLYNLIKERRYTIPSKYLYFFDKRKKQFFDEHYVDQHVETQFLRIKDGKDLFSNSNRLIPARFMERYQIYSQNVTTEMVAFAWRVLAIRGDVKQDDLIEEIEFYLRNQGLEGKDLPRRDKIKLIVGRIREQRRRGDVNSAAFVSSNPKDQKREV